MLLPILLPPLAVAFLGGRTSQVLFNLLLTLLLWIPGIIHALLLAHEHHAEVQSERIMRTMERADPEQRSRVAA
jgi:uncharacterized membrane protein YqaE (UPF0057 family)